MVVSTRNTPRKTSPHKGKATSPSPLNEKLGDLTLTKQPRKARSTPRKSLKQSPKPTGASRRRQNATDKRKQTKQQLTKERRLADPKLPPSPHKDNKVVSLAEHKQRAAEMSTSLLSQVNNITAVGPNEINKEM